MRIMGMARTEAAALRARNVAINHIERAGVTGDELVALRADELVAEAMSNSRRLSPAELAVTNVLSESEFQDLHEHASCVRKDLRFVSHYNGSYAERVEEQEARGMEDWAADKALAVVGSRPEWRGRDGFGAAVLLLLACFMCLAQAPVLAALFALGSGWVYYRVSRAGRAWDLAYEAAYPGVESRSLTA